MIYKHMLKATFIERPNRFIAYADLLHSSGTEDSRVTCHVKNTGRCKELLVPGCQVFLQYHPNALAHGRKTEYSLISVCKKTHRGCKLINMDSQAPNQAAFEWVTQGGFASYLEKSDAISCEITQVRREVTFKESRFDLAFLLNGTPSFMEVKGVTLEEDGTARFPDAPTQRGVKHLLGLENAVREGYQAFVFFVITMKGIRCFEPNMATHPAFGETLSRVQAAGVRVVACDCLVTANSLDIDQPVKVICPEI